MTMRKLALLTLPVLALSCQGSRWDGVYQVQISLNSWNCTGDTELFDPGAHLTQGAWLSVRHTSADTMVVELTNLLLAGPHDGASFDVSTSSGYTDSSCERNEYEQMINFVGDFTDDLGIEGTLSISEAEVRQGCAGSTNVDETCVVLYDIRGFLLDNFNDRHVGRGQWGYTPGSSY